MTQLASYWSGRTGFILAEIAVSLRRVTIAT